MGIAEGKDQCLAGIDFDILTTRKNLAPVGFLVRRTIDGDGKVALDVQMSVPPDRDAPVAACVEDRAALRVGN